MPEFLAHYSVEQIIHIAIIVTSGALLQSAVGFGFALFAMPLLLLAGLPLHEAILISMVCQIAQELVGLVHVRKHTPVGPLLGVMISGVVFLALGAMFLKHIESLDQLLLRRIIGIIILLAIAIECFWKHRQRAKPGRVWALLAGASAGALTATIGMTGPPIVLWVMAHDWSNRRSRGSIWIVFLSIMVPMLALLAGLYRQSFVGPALISVILSPLVLLSSTLGVAIGNKIPKNALRLLAFGLLTIIAISAFLR